MQLAKVTKQFWSIKTICSSEELKEVKMSWCAPQNAHHYLKCTRGVKE